MQKDETRKRISAQEIEEKVNYLLKRSAKKNLGLYAKMTGVVSIFTVPIAIFDYFENRLTGNSTKDSGYNIGSLDYKRDQLDPKAENEGYIDYLEQNDKGEWVSVNGNQKGGVSERANKLLDTPLKTSIAATAITTLFASGVICGLSLHNHKRARKKLVNKYQSLAERNPDFELPSNEQIMQDHRAVRRWGTRVIEDKYERASSLEK